MSQEIKLTRDGFETAHTSLKSAHEQMLACRENCQAASKQLLQEWKGKAFSTAQTRTDSLDTKFEQVTATLQILTDNLWEVLEQFEGEDASIASTVAEKTTLK